MLLDALLRPRLQLLERPLAPGDADDGTVEHSRLHHALEGGKDLLEGEVAGGAVEDDRVRARLVHVLSWWRHSSQATGRANLDSERRALLRLPMTKPMLAALLLAATAAPALVLAQQPTVKPEETEVWSPVPKIVTPGATDADAPSDAIQLFNGVDLHEWVAAGTQNPAQWTVHDGIVTVNKKA